MYGIKTIKKLNEVETLRRDTIVSYTGPPAEFQWIHSGYNIIELRNTKRKLQGDQPLVIESRLMYDVAVEQHETK